MSNNYRRVAAAADQRDEMQQAPIMLPAGMNGTAQMVLLIPAPPHDRRPQRWNQGYVKGMGMTLMLIAMIAIVCNIGWFFISQLPDSISTSLAPVGVGFWAGGLVLVTGVLLTISGFRPSRCLIVSVLVMSIVTNVFDTSFIIVGAFQATLYRYDVRYYDLYYNEGSAVNEAKVGFGVLYIVIGLVCFGLLLTASILSCVSLCSRRNAHATIAYGKVIGQRTTVAQSFLHGPPLKVDSMQMNYACAPVSPPPYVL